MFGRHLILTSTAAAMLLTGQHAAADLVFEDVFPGGAGGYETGSNLRGQNPSATTGFSGAWGGSNTSAYQPSTADLVMPGIANSGGSLVNSYGAIANQTRSDSRAIAPYTGSDTLWFSSLVQFNQGVLDNTNGSSWIGFLSDELPTTSSGGTVNATWRTQNGPTLKGFAWGIINGNIAFRYQSGSDTVAGSGTLSPSFALKADTPYLFLARLDVNAEGNDTLNVWFLQSAPADEASLGTPLFSLDTANLVNSNTDISRLVVFSGSGTNAATVTWDAIRMGTELGDLVIVPEPSAMGLMGLSGMLALGRRSR